MATDRHKIIDAIKKGDTDTVRALLEGDAALANAVDETGVTGLMLTLYYKHPGATRALLASGANIEVGEAAALGDCDRLSELLGAAPGCVSQRSMDGFTPLHFAAFFGHPEAARKLLAAGADANALAENASKLRPLHSACAAGVVELVALLLEHKPDVNAVQAGGYTPLHAAAKSGDVEITRLLLAAGADAFAATDDGKTSRDLAHADVRALLG